MQRTGGLRRGKDKKERKDEQDKNLHGLSVPPLVDTRVTEASECGHFPYQVRIFPTSFPSLPLDCYIFLYFFGLRKAFRTMICSPKSGMVRVVRYAKNLEKTTKQLHVSLGSS